MQLTKIVITGGPCAGKTTAMERIRETFTQTGYRVLFVPETATELITGGVAPWTCGTNAEYQICQVSLQLAKEALFLQGARTMPADKILLVLDRGAMDNRAYMTDKEFAYVLSVLGLEEATFRNGYDAVFHLVTAAKGAEEFYTTANNSARIETPAEAADLDDRLLKAWEGHPYHRVIGNEGTFADKLNRLTEEISRFLEQKTPTEIERKFLIAYPDLRLLESMDGCVRHEILQTYLCSAPGVDERVRKRVTAGETVYFHTVKEHLTPTVRTELETEIDQAAYETLLERADPAFRPLEKTRFCIPYAGQILEIDVYPFLGEEAILEIELPAESTPVRLPPFLQILREATGDKTYSNRRMARKTPAGQ